MLFCGERAASGDKPSYTEAAEWYRKASASPNKALSVIARIRLGIAISYGAEGRDENARESRALLTQAVADPIFEKPEIKALCGLYQNLGQHALAFMLFYGKGGPADTEAALRVAQAAIADGYENEQLQEIAAKAADALRRQEKSKKTERIQKNMRVRGGHAGVMLLRLAEIAVMAAFVPFAQKIFGLGGGAENLLAAAHYAVLGFLLLSIPWLLFYLFGRDDPGDLIGWLFGGTMVAAACTYGVFRLERSSVVRAHYHTYIVALTALGACLIVYFLYRAVRHLAGIFTGK